MKFKTDDIVYYDGQPGVVVTGYPSGYHKGFSYDIYWPKSGLTAVEVWESDVMSETEYRSIVDEI